MEKWIVIAVADNLTTFDPAQILCYGPFESQQEAQRYLTSQTEQYGDKTPHLVKVLEPTRVAGQTQAQQRR